jgi:hypothetical protein
VKGIFGYLLRAPLKVDTYNYVSRSITGPFSFIAGDQEGLFKLAIQLRTFFYSAIYNTATGYVLWVYLTDI